MEPRFIVTQDSAYYPSIDYFNTLDEALAYAKEEIKRMDGASFGVAPRVVIASIISMVRVKTYEEAN